MENRTVKKPDCYEPEKGAVYALCIGKNMDKCKECNLRADFEDSFYAGNEG